MEFRRILRYCYVVVRVPYEYSRTLAIQRKFTSELTLLTSPYITKTFKALDLPGIFYINHTRIITSPLTSCY